MTDTKSVTTETLAREAIKEVSELADIMCAAGIVAAHKSGGDAREAVLAAYAAAQAIVLNLRKVIEHNGDKELVDTMDKLAVAARLPSMVEAMLASAEVKPTQREGEA